MLSKISKNINQNMEWLNEKLDTKTSFDIIAREIEVGGKQSVLLFLDGFCKDDIMQKIIQFLIGLKQEDLPDNIELMSVKNIPYVEVDLEEDVENVETAVLSGMIALLIDGYARAILIDARTYPTRGVEEPEKDKSMRGSKDGFVETIVFNTALIRRRIRSTDLKMEMFMVGKSSKTDVVVCYMQSRANQKILSKLKEKLQSIRVDALSMNQQSLAEELYRPGWINPFPKFKYTERPDTAAAQVMEGSIIILVDNSPLAMILPTTIFDIMEESDDYYFPPITGSYLRITRLIITALMYFVTPTFLLLINHPNLIPQGFEFIVLKEASNIPVFWQFLLLELALDGLRLAAVNTPNMLSTPLSIMAALILGEFSVNSGWFNAEVMLYMAFVAIATYTQPNYELGYAIKFLRIIGLISTQLFGLTGYIIGLLVLVLSVILNRTAFGTSYIAPLIPFNGRKLLHQVLRMKSTK